MAERQQWETMVNAMLMLLVALLAVAIIVAVIGVANTLSLSVIERTRESATLRAIGMTRGQRRSSLAIEAVLISVVSSVVGMVVGTLAMLMLLVALLAVAVIVAVIGVANTLSLSVIERTRESATLRAIGMTRGQRRSSLAIEAVLISVVSSVVGMVVGTLFGWLGINMVMSSIATVVYPVDWRTYGIILAIAIVCALVASVFPSRCAAKTPPVEALAET